MTRKKSPDDKYIYNKNGKTSARVGQAVVDILSKNNHPEITVDEIINESSDKYLQEFRDAVETGSRKYQNPFYIFVLNNKEFWATNVMRNWFIPRQTPPHATDMIKQYPNHSKTLYIVDSNKEKSRVVWAIPGHQDCISVSKNPSLWDHNLITWIEEAYSGQLDKESFPLDPQ